MQSNTLSAQEWPALSIQVQEQHCFALLMYKRRQERMGRKGGEGGRCRWSQRYCKRRCPPLKSSDAAFSFFRCEGTFQRAQLLYRSPIVNLGCGSRRSKPLHPEPRIPKVVPRHAPPRETDRPRDTYVTPIVAAGRHVQGCIALAVADVGDRAGGAAVVLSGNTLEEAPNGDTSGEATMPRHGRSPVLCRRRGHHRHPPFTTPCGKRNIVEISYIICRDVPRSATEGTGARRVPNGQVLLCTSMP